MASTSAPASRQAPAISESELLAKYFRAFGDPTRVRILGLLRAGEASVGELVAALDLAQPKVSNHLACLRWCGLVESRREHRAVFYRVADERVLSIVALAAGLLRDNTDHVAACARIDGVTDAAEQDGGAAAAPAAAIAES